MDSKVKIREIADEAGIASKDMLEIAKGLGYDVKSANSTVSIDDAGKMVEYVMSGEYKASLKKDTKPKIKKVAKAKAETPKTPKTESKTQEPEQKDENPPKETEESKEEDSTPKEEPKRLKREEELPQKQRVQQLKSGQQHQKK